jgi:hypothetical protein
MPLAYRPTARPHIGDMLVRADLDHCRTLLGHPGRGDRDVGHIYTVRTVHCYILFSQPNVS